MGTIEQEDMQRDQSQIPDSTAIAMVNALSPPPGIFSCGLFAGGGNRPLFGAEL